MLIKMLETRRGSEDAFKVRLFEENGVYDVADSLAGAFISQGSARRATEQEAAEYLASGRVAA